MPTVRAPVRLEPFYPQQGPPFVTNQNLRVGKRHVDAPEPLPGGGRTRSGASRPELAPRRVLARFKGRRSEIENRSGAFDADLANRSRPFGQKPKQRHTDVEPVDADLDAACLIGQGNAIESRLPGTDPAPLDLCRESKSALDGPGCLVADSETRNP